jgi:hypothetical protein
VQLGDQQPSGNVEDRRGIGVGGGIGIGGVVIALVAYFLGFDPSTVLNVAEQVSTQRADTREVPKGAPADPAGQFVAKVLGSTETVWGKIDPRRKVKRKAFDLCPLGTERDDVVGAFTQHDRTHVHSGTRGEPHFCHFRVILQRIARSISGCLEQHEQAV